LALFEENCFTFTAGDSNIGIFSFAGAVNNSTHYSYFERFTYSGQITFDRIGQSDNIYLCTTAGWAANQ
jgi:hypothetical protein